MSQAGPDEVRVYHHYTRSAEDTEIKTRIWQKCDPQVRRVWAPKPTSKSKPSVGQPCCKLIEWTIAALPMLVCHQLLPQMSRNTA